MGIWNRLMRRETRATVKASDPYLGEFLAGRGLGNSPSPYLAENLAAVLAAVNAISSAISALPCYVYVAAGGGRRIDETHPLQRLIRNGANDHQSFQEFIEWILASALLRGNGLAESVIDRSGAVVALRPFPWSQVAPLVTNSGMLVFDVTDGAALGGPQVKRRLLETECLLLRDRSDDGYLGRSRLSRAARTVSTAIATQEHAERSFGNGMFPSGALSLEAQLPAEKKKQLRQQVAEMFAGSSNAGRFLILDSGLKFDPISMTPEDAELLASRRFTGEELARLFSVPPPIIGDYQFGSFTNAETAGRWFGQHCLRPWIAKLQAGLARACFTEAELTTHSIEFDMSDLLRGDPETRWKSHQIAVDSGVLTPNEVREVEGWNPRPDGNNLRAKAVPAPLDTGEVAA